MAFFHILKKHGVDQLLGGSRSTTYAGEFTELHARASRVRGRQNVVICV